jgi:hypothetical protein
MYLLIKLTTYDKSGCEQIIAYIKEPTTLEYRIFENYKFEEFNRKDIEMTLTPSGFFSPSIPLSLTLRKYATWMERI